MTCANHPERERIAYCQNCGKPLCQECTRSVGTAVYCEPCLAAKLAGVPASGPGSYSYSDPVTRNPVSEGYAPGVYAPGGYVGDHQAQGPYTYQDPITGAYTTGIAPGAGPNPALAGLLGLIPGVGAMYNEQYAKGIVHLIVFAVLVTLADQNGIFGLFIAGWVFYMVIEAHHTARARRDGLPLPNPFGLNDLGEKLGFGKAWPSGMPSPGAMPPDPYAIPFTPPAPGVHASTEGSGRAAGHGPAAGASQAAGVPPAYAAFVAGEAQAPNWGVPPAPAWQSYTPPSPPLPLVSLDNKVPYPGNRFPAGAIWLIGFGALFLVANAGIFHGFSGRLLVPFFLIGLAVFIFVKKMTVYGAGLADDGSAGYHLRVVRALKGSVWLALVGLLFFLDEFRILSWGHSWPLFIILAGVMTVLQRTASTSVTRVSPYYPQPDHGSPYGYPPQTTSQAPPAQEATAGQTSGGIAPSSSHDLTRDREGR